MAAYKPFKPAASLFATAQGGPIVLREEQLEAIKLAKKQFGKTDDNGVFTIDTHFRKFLWNAKMRFGKTLCAMELVRQMGVQRVLIVTHRPVVNKEWYDNFAKIFTEDSGLKSRYDYGTKSDKDHHGNYYDLEKYVKRDSQNHYVFFASMQYLRRSSMVTGREDEDENQLKKDILNTDWDLVIIDEAHEGTRTALGQRVIELLKKQDTKMLHLSGTPFNLYEDFANGEIYTWDYIQEQQAKNTWNKYHPGESNPYDVLPQMKILTFDLTKLISNFVAAGGEFKFTEFFRTWTGNPKADGKQMPEGMKGRFIHEKEVKQFLDKLCEESETTNYPFSKDNYLNTFNHTLWIVPGVKEAKALAELLHKHEVFSSFKIINVAGNGDDDEQREDALDKVKHAIDEDPEQGYTITISCGKLTTGVTIKQWTAVFYLKGSEMTSASTYMQTIFRVQSPWTRKDGSIKKECYVFDFAPQRTLKMVAETAKFSSHAKKNQKKKNADGEDMTQEEKDKETMREFLDLCPVLSLDGGVMTPFDENRLFKQLDRVYIDRLVLSGFDDNCLYNQDELMSMDANALKALGEKIGEVANMKKPPKPTQNNNLLINKLTDEQRRLIEEARRKARENRKKGKKTDENLTPEELAAREAWRKAREEAREERNRRIANIKGISLRVPLLMYGGADVNDGKDADEPLTTENFTRKIKDESWKEFMPKGVTKKDFNAIRKVFNATRFEEAGKRYRELAKEADVMHVEDRIKRIADIFDCFRNPDKETVLTPWRVVNMHMSETLGGYCFWNERFDGPNEKWLETNTNGKLFEIVETNEPRFVDHGEVTRDVFEDSKSKILEVNSKTGLYPLYVTYTLYRHRKKDYIATHGLIEDEDNFSVTEEQVVWDDVLQNNIYVICNTPMAKLITKRTLCGFRNVDRLNIKEDKLIERATTDQEKLVADIKRVGYWRGNTSKIEMKFNAVIGNPPYQVMDGGTDRGAIPVYNLFVETAKSLNPNCISMIMPARWYAGGRGLDDFRKNMINDTRLQYLYDYELSKTLFPTVDIAGGLCVFLWNNSYNGPCTIINDGALINRTAKRYLNEYSTLIRSNAAIPILSQITNKTDKYLTDNVLSINPFGFRTFFRGKAEGEVRILTSKGWAYVDKEEISKGIEYVDKYKIIIGRFVPSNGEMSVKPGEGYRVLTKPQILKPNEINTETYIDTAVFSTKEEARNYCLYLHSKFVRYLLRLGISSVNVTRECFAYVPLQDFTSNSDIDWSENIADIDKQLYKKYNLSEEEIAFIEKMIKPME